MNTTLIAETSAINFPTVYSSIHKLHPTLSENKKQRLASAVIKLVATNSCTIDWNILLSIAFHESSFNKRVENHKTKDYGLMQFNSKMIRRLGLDKKLLLSDEFYSLAAACKLLEHNRNRYSSKIKYWLGIYRSGVALHDPKIVKNAISYDKMIRKTAKKMQWSIASE